jgi:hypothetical protein
MAKPKPEHPKDIKIIFKTDQAQLDHLKSLEGETLASRSEIIRALVACATPEQVRACVRLERGL